MHHIRVKNSKSGNSQLKQRRANCLNLIFGTEIWTIVVSLLLQELPFLLLRFYILVYIQLSFNSKRFSIIFFALKNLILCTAEIYRTAIIVIEHRQHS